METRARRHCRRRQAGRVAVATRRLKTQPAGQAGRCADTAVGLRECGRVGEHGVIEEWGVGWCDVPMYLHHLFFLCFFSTALSLRCRTGVSVGVSQRLSVKGIQRLQLLCGSAACVSAVGHEQVATHIGAAGRGTAQRCTPFRRPGQAYCRTLHVSLENAATNGLRHSQHAGLRSRVIAAQPTMSSTSRRRRWCCRYS